MLNYTGTYTDKYQLTMAQVYFLKGHHNQNAIFDYFFRKLPFNGGYAVFAGLENVLEILETLCFDKADIEYLQAQGFHPDFLKYLQHFRFQGSVYACEEGDLIFPGCPVICVEANIIEAQLIETILLNLVNFQSLIATKARRIQQVAGGRKLMEFGLRRAQGPGGYYASRASIIGGFDSSSNVCAGRDFNIPISGTMAHSFIQSYDSELTAFRDFAENWPNECILLVDTYNTLQSGIPNAITVAREMETQGKRLKGIRLDSGDLAFLSRKARQMLDDEGLNYITITASNQLDEYIIKSLLEQKSPIDAFGVGTNLVVGSPDAALDGVYKLAFAKDKPRIKVSENPGKITLPGKKQTWRILDNNDHLTGADVIALADEVTLDKMHHPFDLSKSFCLKNTRKEPLLKRVMHHGKRLVATKTLGEISAYSIFRLDNLPEEYKRLTNPHLYKVGLSDGLKQQRDQLMKEHEKVT